MLRKITPIAFILLWIVPVAWVGLMRSNYPLYPSWVAPLFRVSGIFESAPPRWRIFFIEIQDKRDGKWREVDESLLFASTPLGNRTRFQQLMNEMASSAKPSEQTPRILSWIGSELPKAGRSLRDVTAVRIVHFAVPPETFLKNVSLSEVYQVAASTKMPRIIMGTLNLRTGRYEKS